MKNNQTIEEEILRDKKVRGFSYNDENGVGYVYPLNDDDDDEEEDMYEVQGECTCCVECNEDDDCNDEEMICRGNKCLEKKGINCNGNNDCENDEICNYDDGVCVKGCKNNDNCESKEICNWNGKCIKGCLDDNECENEELCINNICSSSESCRDNFDCDSYDSVCIDNQCVFIDDNSETCSDDIDCLSEYYCDFEYLICLPKRSTSFSTSTNINNRRKITVLPAVCSLYGIISLFMVTTTYSIASKIAKDKLNDECVEKCSNLYYVSDSSINNLKVEKKTWKYKTGYKRQTVCTGSCRTYSRLYNVVYDSKIEVIRYAEKTCHKRVLTSVITVEDRVEKNGYVDGNKVFAKMLTQYCKKYKKKLVYKYQKISEKKEKLLKYQKTNRLKLCAGDMKTIRCKNRNIP